MPGSRTVALRAVCVTGPTEAPGGSLLGPGQGAVGSQGAQLDTDILGWGQWGQWGREQEDGRDGNKDVDEPDKGIKRAGVTRFFFKASR